MRRTQIVGLSIFSCFMQQSPPITSTLAQLITKTKHSSTIFFLFISVSLYGITRRPVILSNITPVLEYFQFTRQGYTNEISLMINLARCRSSFQWKFIFRRIVLGCSLCVFACMCICMCVCLCVRACICICSIYFCLFRSSVK